MVLHGDVGYIAQSNPATQHAVRMITPSILSLLSAVPVSVVAIDRLEHVVGVNPSAASLFGHDNIGRHVVTVIRQPAVLQAITRCLLDVKRQETRFIDKDHAHETLYKVVCEPVSGSEEIAALVSFQDVTSQETAGQMRRDFVANVSHELRTPLTVIQGFIETLQGPARGDPKASERFLQTMATEAERMVRLVNDLLSLSQVESEERVRPTERVELHEALMAVVGTLTPLATVHEVELRILAAQRDYWVLGDPDQLVQVFTNLVENAIKYAPDGKVIEMVINTIDRDPILGQRAVQIDVKDRGAGFDEMHAHRLTERFYRVDNHRSRSLGGTGLGLAIVKHIVNRHKGRLRITSEIGKGSCFSVILPVA